ncbi:hypothetical protein P8V03_11720 [Clostridium sp. A1-XYC3]|uniref:Uncharacterized protein n=1 Tax=Clostridium tanneri TaxID=3037988 RepID=A0ABU4JUI9_9CLOT|nr:hypothetical protein [Clostridium sp. A1-XYC3]MDW8801813.1 hypothetical protein [Clostridium sp. A1-XYC3]
MKVFKRIFLWIMISLTVQFAGLYYANSYILSSDTSIKTKKVVKSDTKKPDAEVKIPEGAKHVGVSFDGRYLAYYDGDVLKVVDTKTGEEKNVEFDDGVQVSFYKWLSDRNRMLIAEKETSKRSSNFKLAYYDVDKDIKEEIKELDWADKNAEVEDIQASPLTNIIYVKVANSGKRSSIYWINIMKEMKKADTNSYVIGKIRVVPHEDKLVYEDLTYNRISVTGKNRSINIDGVKTPSLIAVDDNDNVYIGDTQDGKVTKIYYGNVNDDGSQYKSVDLREAVNKDDIFVASQGKIYTNDNLKGTVREFGSGKEFIYPGIFVQMYEGGVVSISDGKLVKTIFN